MSALKLMLVEDDDQDCKTCLDTCKVFQRKTDREINIVVCKNIDEAAEKLDNTYDGAIIDLKIGKDSEGGNKVSDNITTSFFRIPIIIFTATPANTSDEFEYVEIYKKGEVEYGTIFEKFIEIYDTGMTKILGGRGEIEKTLGRVFQKNLLPRRNTWIKYGKKDTARTEKSILRYTLNHLLLLLDEEGLFFPEEVYICPPVSDRLYTGSIVKRKDQAKENPGFVILTPVCDLVIRKDGNFKTDRILLIEIDDSALYDEKGKIDKRRNNSLELYLHWLPRALEFKGGFLNFRKITTITAEEYNSSYEKPFIQIAPSFIKDIISRFSSFYARQGQPNIDIQDFPG
ncbi:MAG: hypothetical protein LBE13_17780 [Bacteroidales bacterium]|jgi:hypothetical protein|nr:hypothetical protein [Bacteroidales bacterium]